MHAASARIQLMGRADANVVRDYEDRESRIQRLIGNINTINSRATTLKQQMYYLWFFFFLFLPLKLIFVFI